MTVVKLSSLFVGVRWNSTSFLHSPSNVQLIRVPISCRGRPRHKNFGSQQRKHLVKRIPLNRGPLNDNSSYASFENTKNEASSPDGRLDSVDKIVHIFDTGADNAKYSEGNAPCTTPHPEEVVHSTDCGGRARSKENQDDLYKRKLDAQGCFVHTIDLGGTPTRNDTMNSYDSVNDLGATNLLIHFLDHPVSDELPLFTDSISDSKETLSAPLPYAHDSVVKDALCADSVADNANPTEPLLDDAHYTEPVTQTRKQSQEFRLDDSVDTSDITEPVLYSTHLLVSDDSPSINNAYSRSSRKIHLDATTLGVEATENVMEVGVSKEKLVDIQLEDLLVLINSAEKNILLLNQARLRALEDVDKILKEKELLQGEIDILQMKLTETDARLKLATQDKRSTELLEEQILQKKDASQSILMKSEEDSCEISKTTSINGDSTTAISSSFLCTELKSLKENNMSLKCDLAVLTSTLADIRETSERLLVMEKARPSEGSYEQLGLKLASAQDNVTKIRVLTAEFNALCSKVDRLETVVESTFKQSEQTVDILQRNLDLWEKVDELETFLEEVKSYQLSLQPSQQYNKLLEQQIQLLEDRLLKSDKDIQSQIHLYTESLNEFQNTLERIKKESDRQKLEQPVDDIPWDFWSHLLLCLDGWLLEKKIASSDAKLLREMAWKKDARIRDVFMACKDKQESEAVTAFLKLVSPRTSPGIHVVHIAAEMAPVAKVGGLGDVVSGLGKALQRRGHLVEIILPKYDCMQYSGIDNLKALNVEVESYFDGQLFKNKVWIGIVEGLPVYFIEPHHPAKFFWRGQFYGENDDFRRFSFFSRAALEFLHRAGKKPDIIHCHDWQTAFVAPLYWEIYAPKGLNSARMCFTCHNFEYQGTAPASDLTSCGLDATQLNRHDRMQDHSAHHKVNSVKGGVVFSNIVTTVSPTYAEEVQTAEGGHGMHHTLHGHSKKFMGILNGIDTDAWNPSTDPFLSFQYVATNLQGKRGNKDALRKQLGLFAADTSMPLVGCITRLVPQKGVHLIRHTIYRTLELGGQFVLLGSSPVPHIQREFEDIANHFRNHPHIRLVLKYDEALAHTIYAASDMFVIPSIFEPCGLTQMISMRYGSIPVVRRTGGLNDSVFDVDDETIPLQFRNGFTFASADEQGLNGALERAFTYYNRNPEMWQQLVKRAMNIDFGWESSAKQYEDLYEKSLARARASSHL